MRRKTRQEISGWSYAASAYLNDIPTEQVEKFLYYTAVNPFPVHRRFGAVLPPGRHERAFLAEVRSTAYGDLGTKVLLSSLVAVSR